jgi:5-methylcytosine-specific restriction enzyme subunit McrC
VAEHAAVLAKRKVGVTRIGPVIVRIQPKIPIHRILFLLGFTSDRGWRSRPVPFAIADDLVTVITDAYLRQIEPALEEGPMQSYHEVEDELTVVRGRIREQDQLRRRFGVPVPIHVRFDEFSSNIPENQILRTAAHQLLRLPGVAGPTRSRLRHVEATLAAASLLPPGTRLPTWHSSRLNQRLHLALWLAELILRQTSFDQPRGTVQADGFIVDIAKVFEDFVTQALGSALDAIGGNSVGQRRVWLDEKNSIPIQPDLTWLRDGEPTAVIDAKYKAERPSGFPTPTSTRCSPTAPR